MSKRNAKHVVQSEVILLMTAMKRRIKGNVVRTFQEEMSDPLYSNLSILKDTLSSINDLGEITPLEYLTPFLDVISSGEIIGMITGLALTSVEKFLSFRYVDIAVTNDLVSLQLAIEAVANTVTNTKFVGTDHSSDEVILTKILRLLDTLMHAPAGYLISDYAVCKIISSCFRICFEPQLSELLRHVAECTLERIVHLLFTRLPELKEDIRCRKKNLTINMDLSTLNTKSRLRRKVQLSSSALSDQSQVHENNSAEDNTSVNSVTNDVCDDTEEHLSDPVNYDAIQPPGHISIVIEDTIDDLSLKNEIDQIDIGSESQVMFDLARNESTSNINIDPPIPSEIEASKNEKIQYKTEKGIVFKSDLNSSENISDVENTSNDTKSSKSELSQSKLKLNSTSTPYGLACVQKLLSNLIQILSPENIGNISHVRTGLTLITAALESGAEHIPNAANNLLVLLQNDLSKNLISLLQSERLSFFAASVRVCFLLFESMRHHLKFQLEMYLSRLISIIMSENENVPYEYREVALESIIQLWRIPGFITELYLNYDCDLYCSDLLQDLAELFSKISTPDRSSRCLMTTQVIALEALLFMTNTIYIKKDDPNRAVYELERDSSETTSNTMNPILHKKMQQKIGTEKFNNDVKDGLKFLREHGFCQTNVDLALFFRENPRLSKKLIGEFISTRKNNDVLKEYVNSFDSRGVGIDITLRMFLEEFRLPGESANISLVLDALAESIFNNNPNLFSKASEIYIILYAIVMLNVDQHNPNSKKQQTPMTLEQFKRNLRQSPKKSEDIDEKDEEKKDKKVTAYIGNIDDEALNKIFDNIKNEEIVMPSEQKGVIKENYLWKQLLRRASSNSAHYHCTNLKNHSFELFNLVWKSAVNAFVYVFEDNVTTGLYQCASIAAYYNICEIMDKIIIYISKFTNFSLQQETIVAFGKNEKTKLAARVMFQIAQKHADILRDGWKNILDCLVSLFKARLMPKNLIEVEDFISKDKVILLIEEEKSLTRTEAPSVMNWLSMNWLTSSDYSTGQRNHEDEVMKNDALKVVNDCAVTQLIEDTRFLKEASLTELINALINGTRTGEESHIKTIHHRQTSKGAASQTITSCENNLWVDWRDEQSRVFCLELMMKVLLHNSDRISSFLPLIHDHFYTVLIGSVRADFLLERTVVACLRLAIQLLRKQGDVSQVFTCLEILALTKMSVLKHVKLHIVFGLKDLINMHAANIPSEKDWKLILTLLEICGAGTKLDPIFKAEIVSRLRTKEIASVKKLNPSNVAVTHMEQDLSTVTEFDAMHNDLYNSIDDLPGQSSEYNYDQHSDTGETSRGYTSDSELYKTTSVQESSNKWVVSSNDVNKNLHAEIIAQSQPENVLLYSEYPLPPVNQYNIILTNVHFAFKDPLAVEKSCEILSYLVRDPAHITPTNFEACVHTLRVFAEACVKCSFSKKTNLRNKSHQDISNVDNGSSGNNIRKSRSTHLATAKKNTKAHKTSQFSDVESDDEAPFKTSAQIDKGMVNEKLLDFMCTLHDRAAKIYLEWSKKEAKDVEIYRKIYGNLWKNCWCPLLQGMARLCCDVRPEVRVVAMTFLQRALLSPVLSNLNGSQWEDCFTKVLFPLLSCFLESMKAQSDVDSTQNHTEISDPRMRAIQILTKVFLQHLGPLHELSTFTALWLTILEYMDSYMKANNRSDSLDDAVRESLKNVLLVMHTGTQDRAILVRSNDESGQLLKLTCDRLSTFLPDLVEELFGVDSTDEIFKKDSEIVSEVILSPPTDTTELSTNVVDSQPLPTGN